MKILFLLPNMYLNFGVPHGLATLVAILKKYGHQVEVFDFTFIKTERDTKISSGQIMQKTSTTIYDLVRSDSVENIEEKFAKKLQSFKPDLIGVSATSYTFDMGINLLNKLKSSIDCPVIVGGVHASLAPEDAIKPKIVDFICVGEGEKFIIEFCDCLSKGKDYRDILNLGYKINDKIIINKLRPFVDLDSLPAPDWSAFDERHMFRPFMGKVYKGGFYITSRGCPYSCTYCANIPLRKKFQGCGSYFHFQKPATTVRHLAELKRLYKATWFRFADDSLMSMSEKYLEELAEGLKELNIEFACSIRPETTTERKVAILKKMNCRAMSIGVESGNEEIRKKELNRHMTNSQMLDAVRIIEKYGIRATTYIIIGLPGETRENVFETIRFNKEMGAKAATVSYLYPHYGTEIAIKYNKSFRDSNGKTIPMSKASVFNFSKMSQAELEGLHKTYNLYLLLPEEIWSVIKYAEKEDKDGRIIFKALKEYSELLLQSNSK